MLGEILRLCGASAMQGIPSGCLGVGDGINREFCVDMSAAVFCVGIFIVPGTGYSWGGVTYYGRDSILNAVRNPGL